MAPSERNWVTCNHIVNFTSHWLVTLRFQTLVFNSLSRYINIINLFCLNIDCNTVCCYWQRKYTYTCSAKYTQGWKSSIYCMVKFEHKILELHERDSENTVTQVSNYPWSIHIFHSLCVLVSSNTSCTYCPGQEINQYPFIMV